MKVHENGNDFNPVRVTGVVASAAHTGFTQQRKPYTRFSINDDDDGASVTVVCYDMLAEVAATAICEGTRVDVKGYRPSKPRFFQRRDGTPGYSQDVNARELHVLNDG